MKHTLNIAEYMDNRKKREKEEGTRTRLLILDPLKGNPIMLPRKGILPLWWFQRFTHGVEEIHVF